MICSHPITVKGNILPCGKCTFCKIQKTKEWSVRLLCESLYWKKKSMVTLTYSDEFLPDGNTLVKSHLQDFFKRLRARIEPLRIKYFACGEYGESYNRPHFHIALLGCDDQAIIESCWPFGFVYVRPFVWNTVKYVCEYVFKKYSEKYNKVIYGDRLPPFQVQSNGIGLRFIEDYADNLRETLALPVHGEAINLPRYFVDKLGISNSELIKYNSKKNHHSAVVFQSRLDKRLKRVFDGIKSLKDLNNFRIEDYADELQKEINFQRDFNQRQFEKLRDMRKGKKR